MVLNWTDSESGVEYRAWGLLSEDATWCEI